MFNRIQNFFQVFGGGAVLGFILGIVVNVLLPEGYETLIISFIAAFVFGIIAVVIFILLDDKGIAMDSWEIDKGVMYLEEGYELVSKWCFEFPAVALYMNDSKNDFLMDIYLDRDDLHLVSTVLDYEVKNGWYMTNDKKHLQKICNCSYNCSWKNYKETIIKKAKLKHPDWIFNSYGEVMVEK